MKIWLPMDCIDALKECSKLRKLSMANIVYGCLGAPVNKWGGKKFYISANVPGELLTTKYSPNGLAPYMHVDLCEYTYYSATQVKKDIAGWPRLSDKRHYSRMKEAYPDSHPALWNVQAAIKADNFTECLLRFGAFDFRPYLPNKLKLEVEVILHNMEPGDLINKLLKRLDANELMNILRD